ncbi:MAG: ribonuclease HII [Bacteroidota bacterium]
MLLVNYQEDLIEAGCDEAGRGCYAGPVFAAAVILPKGFYHPLLNDSKKVTEKNRLILKDIIEENAIAWAVAKVDHKEIDKINILKASIKAMHLAIEDLKIVPEYLVIDGNRFQKYQQIPYQCIIKGDGKFANIAAASILAKTHRDAYMKNLHKKFPVYNWVNNKGYGTLDHRNAIAEFGLCKYHRKSFSILPKGKDLFSEE